MSRQNRRPRFVRRCTFADRVRVADWDITDPVLCLLFGIRHGTRNDNEGQLSCDKRNQGSSYFALKYLCTLTLKDTTLESDPHVLQLSSHFFCSLALLDSSDSSWLRRRPQL